MHADFKHLGDQNHRENGRRGIIKIFEVPQDTRLNKQMFYVSNLS
jgi:hypothetical protein